MIAKVHKQNSSNTAKISEVLPAETNDKMSQKLKPSLKKHPYTLESDDMSDFRIPLGIFKEYSSIMKGLNKDCQNSFLSAMGVDVNHHNAKIDWEKHIQLNCLLKFDNATHQEYVTFFQKVLDPYNQGKVPKEQFEFTLRSLFKGQFQLKGEDENDDMSVDIKRGLAEKGLVTEAEELDVQKFVNGLQSGLVDIQIFK